MGAIGAPAGKAGGLVCCLGSGAIVLQADLSARFWIAKKVERERFSQMSLSGLHSSQGILLVLQRHDMSIVTPRLDCKSGAGMDFLFFVEWGEEYLLGTTSGVHN